MAKVSVDLRDDDSAEDVAKLGKLTAPLPSNSKAKAGALKDSPRVQLSFTNVPQPIKDAFAAEAKSRGLSMKEMLYECLRAGGISIPDTAEIDGRRR